MELLDCKHRYSIYFIIWGPARDAKCRVFILYCKHVRKRKQLRLD